MKLYFLKLLTMLELLDLGAVSAPSLLQVLNYWPILGAIVALCYLAARGVRWEQERDRLPPSPPGHWLFGNAPPATYPHLQYTRLAETYGPVYTLRYGSRRLCVITRYEAAADIMVKQSHNLADRPRAVAAGELLSNGMRILIIGAGNRLKKYRSLLHAALQPQIATRYEYMQMQNARNFVIDILDEPADFLNHAKGFAASVIMSITYGKTTPTASYSDPEVKQINLGLSRLGKAVLPGAYLVDIYPFLKYIPFFTSELRRFHREELALYRRQLQSVKTRQVSLSQVIPVTPSLRCVAGSRRRMTAPHVLRHRFSSGRKTSGKPVVAIVCYSRYIQLIAPLPPPPPQSSGGRSVAPYSTT
ncbi:cytochrome P450 [Lenzites betulinus]|nr:cytochrome P450 [Lenzites betulinus]